MKNYRQFIIHAEPLNVDLITGALWQLEILGINEIDDYLTAFVYEDSEITKISIDEVLNSLKNDNMINSFKVVEEIVVSKNWNEEWEKQLNIIEVSDRIVIKPSFRDYSAKENQIVVTIDPKMSFGTGEHQTTKIVLKLLEKYITKNQEVLDLGSGTAVLGIAAAKLGAEKVTCVDNDEWCYINGLENIERNEASNISIINGDINSVIDFKYDVVVANINKHILLEIKNDLLKVCKKNGIIILSGILDSDKEEIKRQFTTLGLTALEFSNLDEWIGIVFKN